MHNLKEKNTKNQINTNTSSQFQPAQNSTDRVADKNTNGFFIFSAKTQYTRPHNNPFILANYERKTNIKP